MTNLSFLDTVFNFLKCAKSENAPLAFLAICGFHDGTQDGQWNRNEGMKNTTLSYSLLEN